MHFFFHFVRDISTFHAPRPRRHRRDAYSHRATVGIVTEKFLPNSRAVGDSLNPETRLDARVDTHDDASTAASKTDDDIIETHRRRVDVDERTDERTGAVDEGNSHRSRPAAE